MEINSSFWKDKKVFVTGHTGFKGGWLSLWLHSMGAEVFGYSLPAPTEPSFFEAVGIGRRIMSSELNDIRNYEILTSSIKRAEPEIVFHLAAQSLVRESYLQPLDTFETNIMGTAKLFEACRTQKSIKVVVNVTSDKCYESSPAGSRHRESDPMGGNDPYASSKACAELLTKAYRLSFFKDNKVAIATARAGNVIGGGDWSKDRLIPDIFRTLKSGRTLIVRYPEAVRPWQHVLEPLSGYLQLAQSLYQSGEKFIGAWNFGPSDQGHSVKEILNQMRILEPNFRWEVDGGSHPTESKWLALDSGKAAAELKWKPRWNLQMALSQTLEWHRGWSDHRDLVKISEGQIQSYLETRDA